MTDIAVVRNPAISIYHKKLGTGTSAGSFPTMADVNSCTHFNQAIALYNRRTNQVMATPDVSSYLTSHHISGSTMNSLRTKINTLRSYVGLSAQSWTNSIATGKIIRAIDLDELFTALSFISPVFYGYSSFRNEVENAPYGTFHIGGAGITNATAAASQYIGKSFIAVRIGLRRARLGFNWDNKCLAGISTSAVATLHISFNTYNNLNETPTLQTYCGNTEIVGTTGTWYTTDMTTASGFGSYGLSGDQNISVPISTITTYANQTVSMIIGSGYEMAGTGSGGSGVGGKSSFAWENLSVASPNIAVDFGF